MSIIEAIEARDEKALDAMQIRGAFDENGWFVGYDYRNQAWLECVAGMLVQS